MKILIIRFSSIGDIVLTTPVIRCLKKQVPGAIIHYCTKKSFYPVLSENPYIDKFHFLEEDLGTLTNELKTEKFDFVIDLHNNLRTRILKFKLGVKSRSFDKLNLQKWLLVNFKFNVMPDIHVVDRYMKAAENFGIKNDGAGLDYFIPSKDEIQKSDLPEAFRNGYCLFAIGGQHTTKKMPLSKMKELVSKIQQPLIISGGKEDVPNGEELEKYGLSTGKTVLNLCGKCTLNQSASYVKQADKVYTHDTGLMHIAAAFKKETISIWGNTVPELGMYPYLTPHKIWEVKGLSCRPCSKIGYDKCPKGHFNCMNLQKLEIE